MDDTIYIKSGVKGNRSEMPELAYDQKKGCELGYDRDERALYIGTESGNARLCGVNDMSDLITRIDAINAEIESINTRLSALKTTSE